MRISDWSSDVCSSDLAAGGRVDRVGRVTLQQGVGRRAAANHRNRRQQRTRIGMPRIAEQHLGITMFDHAAEIHHGDLVTDLAHHLEVVADERSEEHTSELQSLLRISYAVFCLKKKTNNKRNHN